MAALAADANRLFTVGTTFSSYNDLLLAKKAYEIANFVNLTFSDSKSLIKAAKFAPKKVISANEALVIYSAKLCCSFGGKKFHSKGKGNRKTRYLIERSLLTIVVQSLCTKMYI